MGFPRAVFWARSSSPYTVLACRKFSYSMISDITYMRMTRSYTYISREAILRQLSTGCAVVLSTLKHGWHHVACSLMKRRPMPYYSQCRSTAFRNHPLFVLTYVAVASSRQATLNLGVQLDSTMSMAAHVNRSCRTEYAQLRCISRIRSSLPISARKTLVHALVTSKLDFGNGALCGITGTLLHILEMVQRAAARVVLGLRRRDHHSMTTALQRLH